MTTLNLPFPLVTPRWLDTGIDLLAGDSVTVSASGFGTWNGTYDAYPEGGYYPDSTGLHAGAESDGSVDQGWPTGQLGYPLVGPFQTDTGNHLNIVPFCLVATVAGTPPSIAGNYPPSLAFRCNRSRTFAAPNSGRLYVAINEMATTNGAPFTPSIGPWLDNTGSWPLVITYPTHPPVLGAAMGRVPAWTVL